MTSLNPEWYPKSWKDILNFIIQVYFGGSKLLFLIGLILGIIFAFIIWFYVYPSIGLGVC